MDQLDGGRGELDDVGSAASKPPHRRGMAHAANRSLGAPVPRRITERERQQD